MQRQEHWFSAGDLAHWNQAVPRYTSYPTVPQWGPISAEAIQRALRQTREPAQVYVHVPFCREQCRYCGCNMVVARRQEAGDRFLQVLAEYVQALTLPRQRVKVQRVHLGGGTPTWLNEAQLDRLCDVITSRFDVVESGEWSIEADPSTVDRNRIAHIASLGFKRISFGVQSLDPEVIEAVGRPQISREIAESVHAAHSAGLSVAIDLMSGLPHQNEESLLHTADQVIQWKPARIALFTYAHVPWVKAHQRALDASAIPGPVDRAQAIVSTRERLVECGYQPIGMDHFAAAGDPLLNAEQIHRNFMGYTTLPDVDLIGLGPSAISEVAGLYWQTPSQLRDWYTHAPPTRGHELTEEDQIRKRAIEEIMCTMRHNRDPEFDRHFVKAIEALEPLSNAGIVHIDTERIRVLEPLLVRLVARAFDAYPSEGRYSMLI